MTDITDAYFSNLIGRLEELKQVLAGPMDALKRFGEIRELGTFGLLA